jgi:spoIIIJ-associated protein
VTEMVELEVEGETVGEAKWLALRELERLRPTLDRSTVVFEVLSEGERGLLGVGRTPARVVARVAADAAPPAPFAESEPAAAVRELLERIAGAAGVRCRVLVSEDDASLSGVFSGGDLGLLIGKHGQTIDAIEYLVRAALHRRFGEAAKAVEIDAAGYRARRRDRIHELAVRCARQAVETGLPVQLEPMPATERKLVHLRLEGFSGVETRSEGEEPNRYVVVVPVAD